ncbi:hypothetical protein AB0C65_35850 [Nocardia sp. NPDC048505]|uniref:hypothetical protein n=1 Tax=Nocardia sp. NPDC048505 TaxID=3155756 RepID=UPI0033D4B729
MTGLPGAAGWAGRRAPLLVEGCTAQLLVLPTRVQLHLAVMDGREGDMPVCRCARQLRDLHHRRGHSMSLPGTLTEIDRARAGYVAEIDAWVARCIRPSPAAVTAPTSLGSVIDKLARAADRATALFASGDVFGYDMHLAWEMLAREEMVYDELAQAAGEGRVRFPEPKG